MEDFSSSFNNFERAKILSGFLIDEIVTKFVY